MSTSSLLPRLSGAYALLVRFASTLQSPLLLAFRLYWGWSFFQTGKGKLGDLSGPTEFFTNLHIPFPAFNAVLVGLTECFGGLFLLLGFASRLTTIPLIVTMIVAYLTAEREALGMIFSNPDKFLESTPLTYFMVVLVIFAFGPGAFSLDYLLGKKFAPQASATPPAPHST